MWSSISAISAKFFSSASCFCVSVFCRKYDITWVDLGTWIQRYLKVIRTPVVLRFIDLIKLVSTAFLINGYSSFSFFYSSLKSQFCMQINPLVQVKKLWKVISQEKSSNFHISDNWFSSSFFLILEENPFSLSAVSSYHSSLNELTSLLVLSWNSIW